MPETTYRARRAHRIENDHMRLTVLVEGGHVAEMVSKQSGVNPLWSPPWPSIEPSTYSLAEHPEYGADAESKLLAGIMGHNLCLDIFGGVSTEEAAAGLTVHGEASVARYNIVENGPELTMSANFPIAQLAFERRIRLLPGAAVVDFAETVENLAGADRPIGWTQHVTLGPPFLERGSTQFRCPGTRSKVHEADIAEGKGYMKIGAEFTWPMVPRHDRGLIDMQVYNSQPVSAGFTTHLMDPKRAHGYFTAYSPKSHLAFGYIWKREDFPWLGIWEENNSRTGRPWNGKTLTRGMEFGASPMPETRRQMIDRGSLFGVPGYRWIPARSKVQVQYRAAIGAVATPPQLLEWSEKDGARFV